MNALKLSETMIGTMRGKNGNDLPVAAMVIGMMRGTTVKGRWRRGSRASKGKVKVKDMVFIFFTFTPRDHGSSQQVGGLGHDP